MAQKIVIELDIEEGKAIQDLDKVKKGFQKVVDEQGKQKKATEETTKAASEMGDKLDAATGGAVTKFRNLVGGIKASTTSLKAMRVAIIATGIGAFVVAIGTLVANLQNSEAGFNRVQKLLKQFGVIAGNVTDIFYSLGTAIFGLVTGDFDLMNQAFEEATNRIKNFGDETQREIALQGELADQQAELTKLERKLVVDRAEANRKRADLLEKAADKENFTAQQRIEFLKEAGKIDEEITNAEIKAAEIRLKLKEQENTLSESSADDLAEEARLKADLINLETQRLTKQKTVTAQITSALREEQAERKAAMQARKDEIKGFKEESDELQAIIADSVIKRQELEITGNENILKSIKKTQAAKAKNLEQEQKNEEALKNAKIGFAQQGLAAITQLAGEGSAVGKAAAVASATIAGIEGVQNAYKTAQASPLTIVNPAYPYIQAGLAAAFSAVQIKSILSTPKPSTSGGAPAGVAAPSGRGAVPQAPSFNVVGAAPENQLAEAIGQREDQPVKAYVVSNEVTNAQALDRNIVESASLG
jgi:hypothetical protein